MDSIPVEFQWLGGAAFAIAIVALAAWSKVLGKKEGPPAPKVQEFYASGQLADMGPVKELVEAARLLMQQQVRTNIALEETSKGIHHLVRTYEQHLAEEQRDREIAEEVARQLKDKR